MMTISIPMEFTVVFDHSEGDGPEANTIEAFTPAVREELKKVLLDLMELDFDALVDTVTESSNYLVSSMTVDIKD